jgi:hypothetical protein
MATEKCGSNPRNDGKTERRKRARWMKEGRGNPAQAMNRKDATAGVRCGVEARGRKRTSDILTSKNDVRAEVDGCERPGTTDHPQIPIPYQAQDAYFTNCRWDACIAPRRTGMRSGAVGDAIPVRSLVERYESVDKGRGTIDGKHPNRAQSTLRGLCLAVV